MASVPLRAFGVVLLITGVLVAINNWSGWFGGEPAPAAAPVDNTCTRAPLADSLNYDQIAAFDPSVDWLFPGALVRPGGGNARRYLPVTGLAQAPISFSVGGQITPVGPRKVTMPEPALSTYRQVLDGQLAQGTTGATAAALVWDSFGLSERGQVGALLNLGADVSFVAQVENAFNWADQNVTSRTLLRFTQTYFTVDVDKPGKPADLFTQGVPEAAIRELQEQGGNYVSSISYGRTVLIAYESRQADTVVKAALKAKLGWSFRDTAQLDAGLAAWTNTALADTTFSGYIYGGSAVDAVKALRGIDAVGEYIAKGGAHSKESPGLPLSYKLSSVEDNSLTASLAAGPLQVQQCAKVNGTVRVALKSIRAESGGRLTLCGVVSVSASGRTTNLLDQNCRGKNTITSGPDQPWESGGEDQFRLATRNGETIELRAEIKEYGIVTDTDLGDRTIRVRFEDGWSGAKEIRLKHDDRQVAVVIELTPVS